MGSWTHMKFSGKGNRVVTLICTYQVCKKQVSQCGPLTATVQQYSLLSQAQRPEPQRVRQHHAKDLVAFVQSCQSAGELVAVMGDFNDILGEENSGLTKLCSECGLKDILYQKHNISNRTFNSYSRGKSCIDYMLLDSELADAVEATGYEPFNIRFPSDHRGPPTASASAPLCMGSWRTSDT